MFFSHMKSSLKSFSNEFKILSIQKEVFIEKGKLKKFDILLERK